MMLRIDLIGSVIDTSVRGDSDAIDHGVPYERVYQVDVAADQRERKVQSEATNHSRLAAHQCVGVVFT